MIKDNYLRFSMEEAMIGLQGDVCKIFPNNPPKVEGNVCHGYFVRHEDIHIENKRK